MTASQQLGMLLLFGSLSFMVIFSIAAFWRIFEKADLPGYLSLIPIVNLFGLVRVAQLPWWWTLGLILPMTAPFVWIVILHRISTNFNNGVGFTAGLYFLPFLFFAFLAFEDNEYVPVA